MTTGASKAATWETDNTPSVVVSGKVDGKALRTRHRERIQRDTSAVTILEGKSALELGDAICEAVVPKRAPATKILLKPNICGIDAVKDPPGPGGDDGVKGRTTDPEFVRGIVQCLKRRGHTDVTIAEGCGLPHKAFMKLLDVSGYARMAAEEHVALVGMNDDGVFDKEGDRPGEPLAVTGIGDTLVPKLLLPRILAEALDGGMFISVPKVKTHRFSVVSLAIKGGQGVVMTSDAAPAHQQKWRMHKELNDYLKPKDPDAPEDRKAYVADLTAFAKRMSAVLEIAAPDVTLADGAPSMGGDGFQQLVPSKELVAIGGTNPIYVDVAGAQLLGLWNNARLAAGLGGFKTSPLIEIAAKDFGVDTSKLVVVGSGAGLLGKPRPVHFKALAPFQIEFVPP